MEVWLVVAVVGVLVVGAFIALSRRVGSTPMFLASYQSEMKRSGSPQQSLRWAIGLFTRRQPFDVLTPTDADMLVDVFAPLPDPTVLAQVFLEADRQRDASMLKDSVTMVTFADYVLSQHGLRRVFVKGPWDGVQARHLQVSDDDVRQYADEQGHLHAMCWFEAGNPNCALTPKRVWDRLDELFDADLSDDERQSRMREVLNDAS